VRLSRALENIAEAAGNGTRESCRAVQPSTTRAGRLDGGGTRHAGSGARTDTRPGSATKPADRASSREVHLNITVKNALDARQPCLRHPGLNRKPVGCRGKPAFGAASARRHRQRDPAATARRPFRTLLQPGTDQRPDGTPVCLQAVGEPPAKGRLAGGGRDRYPRASPRRRSRNRNMFRKFR